MSQLDATALLVWFGRFGRASLPWRTNRTPYRVVVSEFMLQQTQVERVIPAFERFVAAFPSFETLAKASQADVVRAWRGLGYNGRAVRLRLLAIDVCERYGGTLPRDERELMTLPGIGSYTARAIAAFAFNVNVVAFDTNIRRVVHRACFGLEFPPVANAVDLERVAAAALPPGRAFEFNSALMDLGATICSARVAKCLVCPLRTGCESAPIDAATLQSRAKLHAPHRSPGERVKFEASPRFVRGRIVDRLRALAPHERISLLALDGELASLMGAQRDGAVANAVEALEREELIEREGDRIRLRG